VNEQHWKQYNAKLADSHSGKLDETAAKFMEKIFCLSCYQSITNYDCNSSQALDGCSIATILKNSAACLLVFKLDARKAQFILVLELPSVWGSTPSSCL